MYFFQKLSLAMIMACLPFIAFSAPVVTMSVKAEIEQKTTDDKGKKQIQRITADKVLPGQKVFYTLQYENSGDEKATNVVLNNLIPESTTYLADSAWGKNSNITFSIDQGKTFKEPALLVYEVTTEGKTEKRKASPEKYSNIRWTVNEISANTKGEVGFTVIVD